VFAGKNIISTDNNSIFACTRYFSPVSFERSCRHTFITAQWRQRMATKETANFTPQLIDTIPATSPQIMPGDYVLRFDEVRQKTGLCRAHVHALAAQGRFPKPLKLVPGGRASGWLLSEVNQWIADRVAARDSGPRAA
jgi:prophage regulatory protein